MNLTKEEEKIKRTILAARVVQDFLWGEADKGYGFEEWKRMLRKRVVKIDQIDESKPHAIIELKKRLLQNAAVSIALMTRIDEIGGIPKEPEDPSERTPSSLDDYPRW